MLLKLLTQTVSIGGTNYPLTLKLCLLAEQITLLRSRG